LEGHRSRPATCSKPAGRVSSLLKRSGATAAGHTSHRLLRVPPIRLLPLPESHLQAMMPRAPCEPGRHTGCQPVLRGTHKLPTCATRRGSPEPDTRASIAREPYQSAVRRGLSFPPK